jgi:hypothetical protein
MGRPQALESKPEGAEMNYKVGDRVRFMLGYADTSVGTIKRIKGIFVKRYLVLVQCMLGSYRYHWIKKSRIIEEERK